METIDEIVKNEKLLDFNKKIRKIDNKNIVSCLDKSTTEMLKLFV